MEVKPEFNAQLGILEHIIKNTYRKYSKDNDQKIPSVVRRILTRYNGNFPKVISNQKMNDYLTLPKK
ncbi:hypothetical protein HHL17_01060 [Chitinophaga sp. G-6-1-13]|uniref:Uncharacterized protein n=1 Tax=Chitinophaga fulva TaxID=2728842 RepID=A0A848GFA5_9BACT|nr:hypothetical protein [Chitinophaga fulva]NML35772.1 hypothetical protein [Chitinophaga fulva]